MLTILIGGYYGAGNTGDEAILTVLIDEFRAQHTDLSLIVTSWEPEQTSKDFNVQAIHWNDINSLLDAALRADLIILGGGGIFHDYWGIDPDSYLRKGFWDITAYGSLPLLAKLLNVPCMIYAVGVGPLQTDLARQHTRLAFERCQIATVRDTESLELLKETGISMGSSEGPIVKVFPDPVFSLTTSLADDADVASFLQQIGIDSSSALLGVSLRNWYFDVPPDKWLPRIADSILEFLNQNNQIKVILIPFQVFEANRQTNDVGILQELADLINMPDRVCLISNRVAPRFAQALIKRCSVLVGMRLHSIIMGINVATPVVALAYEPKIWSVMKLVELEEFCNPTLTPGTSNLAAQIRDAWNQRDDFSLRINPLHKDLAEKTKQHAILAKALLSNVHPKELQFSQQFALQQVKLLLQADERVLKLEQERRENEKYISDLSTQMAVLASPNFQKLARFYYHLVKETPFKHLYRIVVNRLRSGPRKIISDERSAAIMTNVVRILNQRSIKGFCIVTSSVVFDELFNQRALNLTKFLSQKGWGVVHVAWRWSEEEELPCIGEEVDENVFQVPVDMFLKNTDVLAQVQHFEKYFFIEFPHPDFLPSALELRRNNFTLVYEIIDEWEEFQKVGQADWFNKSIENALVINANFVSAVSPSLIEKFSDLRRTIHLSPNGYNPDLLGVQNRNIARNKHMEGAQLHLGYFGYLTEAWFDWDFLFDVLDLADKKGLDLYLHLIGNGAPDLRDKLSKYSGRVTLYGRVYPSELYKYVQSWDAALIWFKSGKLSSAVDPLKIYDYLYFGLPTIIKGIDHLGNLPFTHVVMNENQVLDVLVSLQNERLKHLEPSKDLMLSIEQTLAQSTWERRFTDLLETMANEKWISL